MGMFSRAECLGRELIFPFFSILPLRTTRDGIRTDGKTWWRKTWSTIVVDGVGDGWLSKSLDAVQCESLQLGSKDLRNMMKYERKEETRLGRKERNI